MKFYCEAGEYRAFLQCEKQCTDCRRLSTQNAASKVVTVAMSFAHALRTGAPSEALQEKFLRVTRALERRSGKK